MKLNKLSVTRYKIDDKAIDLPQEPGHERYIHLLVGELEISWSSGGGSLIVGPRRSVFSPPKEGYLINDGTEKIQLMPAGEAADVLVVSTPAQQPEDTSWRSCPIFPKAHEIGDGNCRRTVYEILGADGPSQHLRCGETVNQRGGWSSYPPHSFDRDETLAPEFEEIFVAFTRPRDGYALMRRKGKYWSGAEVDDVAIIRSGDMVSAPLGSHPIVGAPNTDVMYFWAYVSPESKAYGKWAEDLGTYR